MHNVEDVNIDNLPLVPCLDGQTLSKGMVFDYEGNLIGKHNSKLDVTESPQVVRWSEFSKVKFPENKWLIKDLVPAGGFLFLVAPSGEKKTWVAMVMADSIATGTRFLNQFETQKGAVLYLNGEMPQFEVQRRGRLLGLTETENFWILNKELDFYNDEQNVEWLFETIAEKNIKAVFFDTFRGYGGGIKEEKAEEIRLLLNKFKPLKDMGIALVILDHTRKPTHFEGQTPKKEQLFASQDKVASAELVIMLKSKAGNNDVFVYQVKNRLGKEINPFQIVMQDEVNESGEVSKVSISYKGEFEVVELKQQQAEELILAILEEGGKTTKEIIALVMEEKIGKRNAEEAIRALRNKGKIVKPAMVGKQNFYTLPPEEKEDLINEVII